MRPTRARATAEEAVLQALVERARQGDEEAFAALVRSIGDRSIYIAHRILRDADRAEDAVQAAFVAAWKDLPALRDPDRFEAWFPRLLVNACYAEPAWPALGGQRRPARDGRAGRSRRDPGGPRPRPARPRLPAPAAGGTAKSRLFYATSAIRAALEADGRPPASKERLA